MKLSFSKIALTMAFALVLNSCSSIPDIQPYESQGHTVEELQGSSSERDSLFQIEPLDESLTEAEKELEPANEEPSSEIALDTVPKIEEEPSANVEADLVAVKKAPKKEKVVVQFNSRKQASVFKNGFYTFSADCKMKAQPDDSSADAGSVTAGKKLWLDGHNPQWLKAYKKAGTVYVPAHCIQ